ncbi:MAG: glutamine synthetase III [Eubacteriales bacterium]
MKIPEYFGSMVFDDREMKARLPEEVYLRMRKTIDDGRSLDISLANMVAEAMKDWAVERGATHFTHWFQPMTGVTAEKHDSFVNPAPDGSAILEFSGKELVSGESDASSFPSGGLRATFEARGYTAWDPTSYAFIKENTLCIPTAFCSYGGEALDKKTPLLRSMEALNRQAMRVLKLFGNEDVTSVKPCVGPEQEYFLIDREVFQKRCDLIYTGRTLFGARPPKRQELSDHYYGIIKPRVAAYMEEVDRELWKLGVSAKTEHNEAAPAQHELAPIYSTANIACDHNQLTMEVLQRVAKKHGMICLLHEKPFASVSGSGKHNNWSIQTNTGTNLFKPGDTPAQNAQFLLFLCAVLQAVDDYADLLRLSVASPSNDHRLGSHEAPPAVVSIFLGTELEAILDAIEKDVPYNAAERQKLRLGVHTLPKLPRDNTDRNRTSPFAFTGNKFEFRMLGSSDSIACTNIMLNTAVAESLRQYADELENAADFEVSLHALIRRVVSEHKRIIFNGNGYDEAWLREATEVRGLPNYPSTPDCVPLMTAEKNLALFATHKIYTAVEAASRRDVILDNYCKVLHIEALTMTDMVRRDILPAISKFTGKLAEVGRSKREFCGSADTEYEQKTVHRLSELARTVMARTELLEKTLAELDRTTDIVTLAHEYRNRVFAVMEELRTAVDEAETLTASDYWPYPTYGDIMFSVK